jgi:hypothetical protein
MKLVDWFVVAIATCWACGSSPPPPAQQLTQSKAAVAAAEAVGAQSVPDAGLHLKLAKDQIATAEALIAQDEMEDADLTLRRAEADARLAELLAKEAGIKAEALKARQKIEELKRGR